MGEPTENHEAFLLLKAGGFDLLLPFDYVLRIVEIAPSALEPPQEKRASPSLLGRVCLEGGRSLDLYSLRALTGAEPAPPPAGPREAVEVALEGGSALLLPDELGSIEEHPESSAMAAPALLWAGGRPFSPRAWPAAAGGSLRWEIDPRLLGLA